ncbi:hypothetical protein KUL152_33950 [Tenacibaculum sp. KUL152]|nr:hypothetical protein KUL152_33950 [Tenacibaculum sp. KUL152]
MKLLLRVAITLTFLLLRTLPAFALPADDIVQLREAGKLDEAQQQAIALLQRAEQQSDTQLEADTLFQLGRIAMERNDYKDAQQWLNRALALYQDTNNELAAAKTYRQIGLTYRYQSNYTVALEYLYMALAVFQSNGSEKDIASINNSLGVVLEKMGQFNEAVDYHQKALESNYASGNQQGIASAVYNLGDIRRVMGDYEQALSYFEQALMIDEASGNKKDIAYSSYKIGYVNMQMVNYDIASHYMQRAHSLFVEIGAKRDIDWALSGLSDLAVKQGNLLDAEIMVKGIIERAEQGQFKSLLLDGYQTLIEIYTQQERYNDALALIEQAIPLAEELGELHQVSQLLALKVNTLETLEEVNKAYQALKQQKQLDESLFNQKRLDALASTQAQTEFIRRANEIELLKQQQATQQVQAQSERESRQTLFLIVLLLGLLAFLIYSRRAQSKYTKQLKQEVSARTAELKKANEELAAMSLTDKLTALHNRRFLESHIDADITTALRKYQQSNNVRPQEADLCFFVIDLDNFKQINDTYGHIAGDKVLQQTAKRLKAIFRGSDFLIRWGGEEFVAVARFIDRQNATLLAERVVSDIKQIPFVLDEGQTQSVTCSVGFACFPFTCESERKLQLVSPLDTIFHAADQCLYAAKSSGKATWVGVTDIVERTALPLPSSVADLTALENEGMITLSRENKS